MHPTYRWNPRISFPAAEAKFLVLHNLNTTYRSHVQGQRRIGSQTAARRPTLPWRVEPPRSHGLVHNDRKHLNHRDNFKPDFTHLLGFHICRMRIFIVSRFQRGPVPLKFGYLSFHNSFWWTSLHSPSLFASFFEFDRRQCCFLYVSARLSHGVRTANTAIPRRRLHAWSSNQSSSRASFYSKIRTGQPNWTVMKSRSSTSLTLCTGTDLGVATWLIGGAFGTTLFFLRTSIMSTLTHSLTHSLTALPLCSHFLPCKVASEVRFVSCLWDKTFKHNFSQ